MNTLTVTLDPNSRTPLYLQLHDHLAREIASGAIREGERLPGKRTAAKLLGVSLSTVTDLLLSESTLCIQYTNSTIMGEAVGLSLAVRVICSCAAYL